MKALNSCLMVLICVAMISLSACQMFIPQAKGLPHLDTLEQTQQQQAEIFWKEQSFSFLLYQQQQGQTIHILALTLSGQVLFELTYDGQIIQVKQRSPALKALPLDFLMRDIWWATMPTAQVAEALQPLQLKLREEPQKRMIYQVDTTAEQVNLTVTQQHQQTIIENHRVPYRMILSNTEQAFIKSQP